jgi:DNA-binding MarR family transcriptional regulator
MGAADIAPTSSDPNYTITCLSAAVNAIDSYPYMSRVSAVQRNRPPSAQAISVLRALAADPARWRYGYDLATEVHLKSGSLYPILVRLADRDLLETSWEPGHGSRPPRHLYRLTLAGREYVAGLPAAQAARPVPHPHYRWNEAQCRYLSP